ncbi:MAG: hypothetical protein K0S32_124 [Bacteroidetes bacterium]|jgi:hypothetical protein|nr:hypothetical protein [Bacteroidota bacterium]
MEDRKKKKEENNGSLLDYVSFDLIEILLEVFT